MGRGEAPVSFNVPGHGGVPIHGWDYGGEGPPLLLAHCTGGVSRLWDPVVAALAGRFRAIAVDTRGHGRSGKPERREDYHWENSARDLLAVADGLGLGGGLFAAGHSAGGAHVARAAVLAPERFKALALIEAIIAPPAFFAEAERLAEGARRRKSRFASREDARVRLTSKPPMDAWDPRVVDAYMAHGIRERAGEVLLCCPPEVEAWCYEMASTSLPITSLRDINKPMAIISGKNSELVRVTNTQAEACPQAHWAMLPFAGHFLPQTHPVEVSGILIQRFASV